MRYVCQVCGYIYDEAKEKTLFSELPDDWRCPLCNASKDNFQPAEKKFEDRPESAAPAQANTIQTNMDVHGDSLYSLSMGQLAALCSNLARGCEKQYKEQEAGLFRELAAYFTKHVPAVEDAAVEQLAARLQEDIDRYPAIRSTVDAAKDRGAARICVWGEKVTRMLSSLVERYLKEGESLLADTDIWVCSVCGFVYIGEAPPELCPVCKVPAWKFEKIEGRVSA
ncbi:rubredoxin-like domain-containing protein [Christensenella tenuis]|uniref:Rubredoxin n=1 Tax=Christensenella tenuis TaxID=2763033 RepID=A0ABR7EJV6_9FIRM|nr:rubredoxin [Christensenella tenuis]